MLGGMKNDMQQMTIYPGRHIGWWIDGRRTSGRRFMWTWWPTRNIAELVARLWARLARRFADAPVSIAVRDVPVHE
jgi:hypothetical protein